MYFSIPFCDNGRAVKRKGKKYARGERGKEKGGRFGVDIPPYSSTTGSLEKRGEERGGRKKRKKRKYQVIRPISFSLASAPQREKRSGEKRGRKREGGLLNAEVLSFIG